MSKHPEKSTANAKVNGSSVEPNCCDFLYYVSRAFFLSFADVATSELLKYIDNSQIQNCPESASSLRHNPRKFLGAKCWDWMKQKWPHLSSIEENPEWTPSKV